MKARLVSVEGYFRLLSCNGKIFQLSMADAYAFLTHYDDPQYYSGQGAWDEKVLPMSKYRGETIATVNNKGCLCVENAELFRQITESYYANLSNYLTVSEYAELHGRQIAIVRRLCSSGRISGAVLKGQSWLIPKDSPYPQDARR